MQAEENQSKLQV